MAKTKKKTGKKKFIAELHLTYEMVYDPESEEIKVAPESFNKSIREDSDLEDMLVDVAHCLELDGGPPSFVEGVGYVSLKGHIPDSEKNRYSGIDFQTRPAKPDIDIISNDYI